MSVGSILVGIVLLAALGAAMIQPWRRPARRQVAKLTTDPHTEYEAVVAAIRDLDFDYQAGVVTKADYQPLRNDLAAQAVSLLQALDHGDSREAELEEQIETAVSALRASRHVVVPPDGAGATTCPACGYRVPAGGRFCSQCGAGLEPTCPDCGGPVEREDRFCGSCGRRLLEEVAAV
ncbi:MAG: zinc ribbon domain-containing protein [Anaerolineae bacterium]